MESSHKGVSHGDAFIVNVCIFLRLFGGGKNFKVVLWCRQRRVGAGGCLAGVFARGILFCPFSLCRKDRMNGS